MQTIYDWIAIAAFAGLIVLFLNRSNMDDPPDRVWHYLPPALGCAFANYFGNEGYPIVAICALVAVAAYTQIVLKPGTGR